MYVCDEHKFIFFHIPKTGGSSITKSLRNNFNVKLHHGYHNTPMEMNDLYGGYRSFAFIRNPWDRLVSIYSYYKDRVDVTDIVSFEEFCLTLENYIKDYRVKTHLKQQTEYLHNIDFIGKFENLNEDFQIVMSKYDKDLTLPHINSSIREKDYRKYYTSDDQIRSVNEFFKDDIKLLGYEF